MAIVRVGSHRARRELIRLCEGKSCRTRHFLSPGEFYEIPDSLLVEARDIKGVTHVKKDPDQRRKAAEEKMKARMTDGVRRLVIGLGGKEESYASGMTEFVINTRYGILRIHPYDNWIATRFDDPPRGVYGINDYTGKWNFHAHEKGEQGAHDVFESFSRSLAAIVK